LFFLSNIAKIWHGGWFPLLVAAVLYTFMSTWMAGRRLLGKRLRERLVPLELFLAGILSDKPTRVPGSAVFLSGNPIGTPPALRHNYTHNRVLHECVLVLTVETAEQPRVPPSQRFEVEEVGEGFFRATMRYGFMDAPNIPRDLRQLRHDQLRLDVDQVSYFLGRETLLATVRPGMARWREHLFIWLSRNAQTATHYFHLPAEQVIEVGIQVEL
jgi:KUP system potassium uptake protein